MTEKIKNQGIFSPVIRMEFKHFLPLFGALCAQQLLSIFVNLLDNFMLGNYMESAMSGATVVNQIQEVLWNLVFGVGAGASILAAQYWGKREIEPIKKIFSDAHKTAIVLGIIFTLATFLFPNQILGLLTNEPEILEQAGRYLGIMCWTYLIYSISGTLMLALQGIETAFVGTLMSASTVVINLCLNYVLIYGNFGAPELGIEGAAWATLTSRIIELIIVVFYILFIDKKIHLKFKELWILKTGYYKDFIKTSFPIILSGASWGIGLAAQTAILGHMSAAAIGAGSVANSVAYIFRVPEYAVCNASSVVVGKAVGAGRTDIIKSLSIALQLFFILIGVVTGVLLLVLTNPILSFYNISNETLVYAQQFLLILVFTNTGANYEYPVMGGIIAGGGDTKYQTIVDVLFTWLFSIPFAALSAFVFNWPFWITFSLLKADQLLKCIPNAIYCNSLKWIKNKTR